MTADLRIVLDPRSIAVIGASENPNKIGGRPIDFLRRFGFKGQIWPINPKRTEVQGFVTHPSLDALPGTPDVAVIAVPGALAVEAADSCAAAGVKVAIMMASGFGETADGKAKERALAARARSRGMRIVGPNSQGLANFATGAVASFSSMYLESPPADGPVAVVSQSGAMSVVPYGLLRARGIGVRHSHATGNDCDVTAAELAAAVAEDPGVKLLLLYLESIESTVHLERLAEVARDRDLPVIVLKAGRSVAGQAAARSHTGALANEDRVVDAFLEAHGIWRAKDVAGMVDGAELYLKGVKPVGRRLVVVSNSGATCVMAADTATEEGLDIPSLGEATRAELASILPGFAATANPVDITAALLTNSSLFSQILPVIAKDPVADALLIGIPVAGRAYALDDFARDAAAFADAVNKPLVVAAPQEIVASPFRVRGLAVFPGEAQAVRTLAQFTAHHERMAAARRRAPIAPRRTGVSAAHGQALNEVESLAVIAAAGIPVVPHRLCRSAREAVLAAEEFGGKVVVKGCSRDILHKSEHDLVRLGLTTAEDTEAAFAHCERQIAKAGAHFDGVIVARMVKGQRELMLGANVDSVFGPVVLVGDGGKYVEAMPDTQLLLPPFTRTDVLGVLARLRVWPVLAGVRGEPRADIDAFADAAVSLGQLMLRTPSILSVDINPLIVSAEGLGGLAVDAVVVQASA